MLPLASIIHRFLILLLFCFILLHDLPCFGSLQSSSVASMAGPTIPKLSCACHEQDAETEPMVSATFQDWRAQWHEKLQVGRINKRQHGTRSIGPVKSKIVTIIISIFPSYTYSTYTVGRAAYTQNGWASACWGAQYGWERAIGMIRFGLRKLPRHQVKVSHTIPKSEDL